MQLYHNSRDIKYRSPFGAVSSGETVTLRLDVTADVCPNAVFLRVWEKEKETYIPMEYETIDGKHIYKASVTMPDEPCLVWYSFAVDAENCRMWYCNADDGLGGEGNLCNSNAKSYQITVFDKNFDTPEWFRGAMIYQIFPDRFFGVHENGEIHKKRDEYIIHYDRGEDISFNPHPYENGPACNDFYGGNLKGIIEKLPYIKSLGVSVIYLNPIFDAYSNHKYDTANYKEIDAMFGNEEDFKNLCESADKLGIKIILDGVFSHTGADSVYFNKYRTYGDGGAYNDTNSPYRSWYGIGENNSYDSWWGCSNLPNVNEMEPSYLDYILRDDDSVIKKWLRLGASGWRLDVADELPDEFIKILRSEAKSVKPDAVIIGEVWEDASNKVAYNKQREYLLGYELDSVMNYPFKDSLTAFLMGWENAESTDRRLMSIMENYPKQVSYSLMNLVGTHDTVRIKSLLGGLNPDCGKLRLNSGTETLATYRLKCAMFMQMTFVGVPSIYYGDEVGMQGGRDPYNRAPFPWRAVDPEPLEFLRKMGEIRNRLGVLKTGFYKTLYAKGDVFIYARYFENGKDAFGKKGDNSFAICAINRSFESFETEIDISEFKFGKLVEGIEMPERIKVNDGKVKISVAPVGCKIMYSE